MKTRLEFIYSKESEIARVNYTYKMRDFYLKNYGDKSFKLPLPEGSTLEKLSDDYEQVIEKELDFTEAKRVQEKLTEDFNNNYETIKNFFTKNFKRMPEKITIRMTKYGTGGSYNLPDGMTLCYLRVNNPLGNLIHELIHCQIEESIVQKYNLTQQEKESIVEWLSFSDEKIKALDPNRKYYFGEPSRELLEKVGLI